MSGRPNLPAAISLMEDCLGTDIKTMITRKTWVIISAIILPATVAFGQGLSTPSDVQLELLDTVPAESVPDNPTGFNNPLFENGKLLAFPGAKGYSRFTTHARGCKVVLMNTLEDDRIAGNGKLSFYEAMTMTGCRYVIPTVGGVVHLEDVEVKLSNAQVQNLYFAGQAAPSPGLVVTSRVVNIGDNAKDVLLRHVTFRGAGTTNATRAENNRALSVSGGNVENILIDHISASWATDETTMTFLGPSETAGLRKVSWTNSIMAEGDAASMHPESVEKSKDGLHATGASCMNNNYDHAMEEVSFIGNLIVDQNQRLPVINGCHAEIFDNYIANWRFSAIKVRTQTAEASVHIANNLFAPGDQSPVKTPFYNYYNDNSSNSPIGLQGCNEDCTIRLWFQRFVLGANIGDNYFWPRDESWSSVYKLAPHPHEEALSRDTRFSPSYTPETPASSLWAHTSKTWDTVGHTVPVRDAVDSRIISETKSRTNILGIDDYNRMDGNTAITPDSKRDFSSYSSTQWPASYDKDLDGMADAWELSVGLNPNDGSDHSGDRNGDGLTNIEEFLSGLAGD